MEGLMLVGRVAVVLAFAAGIPLVGLMLLNLRDRRRERILQTVLDELSSRELMGRVAVRVRSGVLWRRSVVMIHILAGAPDEIWKIMTRLSRGLPEVQFRLTGTVGWDPLTPITLRLDSGGPVSRLAEPFAAS